MSQSKHATWGGRFSEGPAELMLRFSESVSFDKRLAPFDIVGSKAHSAMLCSVGILTEAERDAIHSGLDEIAAEIAAGKFEWDMRMEDVHMNIEARLTQRVPAAAKLHTARSRNDQVATDVRLFLMWAADELDARLARLLRTLVDLADRNTDVLIPGYTHLQRAQPVSMAHHLLAYVEMFGRDRERIAQARARACVSPLGSGAIAGTTLPIDRLFTAARMGFTDAAGNPRVTPNSMDAVADRDPHLEFASACALCAVHLSRVGEDLILWSSSEFAFATMADNFTTGSSLMPQKKNPDSLELIRGKAARIQGNLATLLTLVKGLPLTYNRDLQEDKPPLFDSFDQTAICLDVLEATLAGMKVNRAACARAVADPLLLATDVVDYLVLRGVPFREAHHVVGTLVSLAEKHACPLDKLPYEIAATAHPRLGQDWTGVFDLKGAMDRRERPGMPGPKRVAAEIARWRESLDGTAKPQA